MCIRDSSSGSYIIEVFNTFSNCITTDTVEVIFQPCSPFINALANDTITCSQQEVRLDASASNLFNAKLEWTAIDGMILSDGDTPFPLVTMGTFDLMLTDTVTGLFDNFRIEVPVDTLHPIASAGPDKILTCRDLTAILEGDAGISANRLSYEWTGPGFINLPDILQPEINAVSYTHLTLPTTPYV